MLRFSTKDANGMFWRVWKMYAILCVSVLFLFHFAKMYLTVKCTSVLHASMYVHCVSGTAEVRRGCRILPATGITRSLRTTT